MVIQSCKLTALVLATICLPGCGMLRSIEQWKCDHLGMCHFGTQPSSQPVYVPVAPAPALPPNGKPPCAPAGVPPGGVPVTTSQVPVATSQIPVSPQVQGSVPSNSYVLPPSSATMQRPVIAPSYQAHDQLQLAPPRPLN